MTISKKLLMTVVLAGMTAQSGIFADSGDINKQIYAFAQELRKTNGVTDKKVAKWLESISKDREPYLGVAAIASVIESKSHNAEKVAELYRLMLDEKERQEKEKKEDEERTKRWEAEDRKARIIALLCLGATAVGMGALIHVNKQMEVAAQDMFFNKLEEIFTKAIVAAKAA